MGISKKQIFGAAAVAGILLLIGKCQPKSTEEQIQELIGEIQKYGHTKYADGTVACISRAPAGNIIKRTMGTDGKRITTATQRNDFYSDQTSPQLTITTEIRLTSEGSQKFTKRADVQLHIPASDPTKNRTTQPGELQTKFLNNLNSMTLAETAELMKCYFNSVCGYEQTGP
jgi:hypothetical protein